MVDLWFMPFLMLQRFRYIMYQPKKGFKPATRTAGIRKSVIKEKVNENG